MLPKPTTGGSKTRNLGFGTPHAFLDPTLPPNDANARRYGRRSSPAASPDPVSAPHGLCDAARQAPRRGRARAKPPTPAIPPALHSSGVAGARPVHNQMGSLVRGCPESGEFAIAPGVGIGRDIAIRAERHRRGSENGRERLPREPTADRAGRRGRSSSRCRAGATWAVVRRRCVVQQPTSETADWGNRRSTLPAATSEDY
jgi:hypothetical protein